jgi:hypothetical protein
MEMKKAQARGLRLIFNLYKHYITFGGVTVTWFAVYLSNEGNELRQKARVLLLTGFAQRLKPG